MDMLEIMRKRHSVRSFRTLGLSRTASDMLREYIDGLNEKYGVSLALVTEEPKAFGGLISKMGSFKNVRSYFTVCAPADKEFEAGYCGELAVLRAAELGINSCWVSMTYNKGLVSVPDGTKLFAVIALGYGDNNGVPHKSKPREKLCSCRGESPEWFDRGMEGAMLAPTAMNRQKFFFSNDGGSITAKAAAGINTVLDLGIAVCHFELASGKKVRVL